MRQSFCAAGPPVGPWNYSTLGAAVQASPASRSPTTSWAALEWLPPMPAATQWAASDVHPRARKSSYDGRCTLFLHTIHIDYHFIMDISSSVCKAFFFLSILVVWLSNSWNAVLVENEQVRANEKIYILLVYPWHFFDFSLHSCNQLLTKNVGGVNGQ